MKSIRRPLFGFGVLLLTLVGCSFSNYRIYSSKEFSPELALSSVSFLEEVFSFLKHRELDSLMKRSSPDLISATGSSVLRGVFASMDSLIDSSTFDVLQQNLILNAKGRTVPIRFGGNDSMPKSRLLVPISGDSAMLSVLSLTGQGERLLALVCLQRMNGYWKISLMRVFSYTAGGKDVRQILEYAQDELERGRILNAASYLHFGRNLFEAAKPYLFYDDEERFREMVRMSKLKIDSLYRFPISIKEIGSEPVIVGGKPEIVRDRPFSKILPLVLYRTSLSLGDTVRLQLENDSVNQVIDRYFRGVSMNDKIAYRVYDSEEKEYYGFLQDGVDSKSAIKE